MALFALILIFGCTSFASLLKNGEYEKAEALCSKETGKQQADHYSQLIDAYKAQGDTTQAEALRKKAFPVAIYEGSYDISTKTIKLGILLNEANHTFVYWDSYMKAVISGEYVMTDTSLTFTLDKVYPTHHDSTQWRLLPKIDTYKIESSDASTLRLMQTISVNNVYHFRLNNITLSFIKYDQNSNVVEVYFLNCI